MLPFSLLFPALLVQLLLTALLATSAVVRPPVPS